MADPLAVELEYPKLFRKFMKKIKILSEFAWGKECEWPVVSRWLRGFTNKTGQGEGLEQLHALHLLSNFLYFDTSEVRELLKSLYRDIFRYEIVKAIRRQHGDSTDSRLIEGLYKQELASTRFLPLGNPSESSSYLLYYFRQVNNLSVSNFAHAHEALSNTKASSDLVKNYIFLDDFTATGDQAIKYSNDVVHQLLVQDTRIEVKYYVLLATTSALHRLREQSQFSDVRCVLEITEDFKAFDSRSLFYIDVPEPVSSQSMKSIAEHYGKLLAPKHPMGYGDGELILGFSHNVPNNTLPIFCFSDHIKSWQPPFPRYPKHHDLHDEAASGVS